MQVRLCLVHSTKMCVGSPHVQDMLKTTLKHQVPCNNCFDVLLNEESTSILHFSVTKYLQTSLNIFLESEELTEPESAFFVILVRVTNLHLWTTKSPKWATI